MVEPWPQLRMGVTYQSETELHLSGDVKLPRDRTPNIDLDLPLAQSVRWGMHWNMTERIALLTSVGWEDWSTAENLPISTGGATSAIPLKFKDTWRGAIGLHYRLSDRWLLQTGFAYDSSALDDDDRTAAFPVDRQTRFGVGALYDWSESLRVGMACEWLNLGQGKVNTASVKGDYGPNDLFFFGINVYFKKLPWSGWATFK